MRLPCKGMLIVFSKRYIIDRVKTMKRFFIFFRCSLFFFLCAVSALYADTDGVRQFKANNPSGAVVLLEDEIKNGDISIDTYNFLGLSYFQLGEYAKAIDAFERGMKASVADRKQLCYNEGNVAYASGDYEKAESCFSLAVAVSPQMYQAVLNRANSRLMQKKYEDALSDYRTYVAAVPDDPQRDDILRLVSYLEEQLVFEEQEKIRLAEEQKRLAEENERMQAELARREAEKAALEAERQAAEAERRRKLLEDVANSLQQTDSTNMTAGAEDVLDYEYESELD